MKAPKRARKHRKLTGEQFRAELAGIAAWDAMREMAWQAALATTTDEGVNAPLREESSQ